MNTYIINEWNQLCSIPQNSLGYKITVEHFRTNSDIGIGIAGNCVVGFLSLG